MSSPDTVKPNDVKQCCARLYESDFARLLLGDSFHPGGTKLTERLGELLGLGAQSRVLDTASGTGTSALFLADRFSCEVVGVDYGSHNVEQSNAAAIARGLDKRVNFRIGDAECLPFPDASFDAVICECAFCTFPDKTAAAHEFARVLRSGGAIGFSDLTRGSALPEELSGLLAWVACIGDAQPVDTYVRYLCDAGFRGERVESHNEALLEMVNQVRMKLLGAEIMVGLKKLELPGVDFTAAKEMARSALSAVQNGSLGYVIIHAAKPQLTI
jgi:ubiquinone/menaquinone biosynthesis C-methylase UbiE